MACDENQETSNSQLTKVRWWRIVQERESFQLVGLLLWLYTKISPFCLFPTFVFFPTLGAACSQAPGLLVTGADWCSSPQVEVRPRAKITPEQQTSAATLDPSFQLFGANYVQLARMTNLHRLNSNFLFGQPHKRNQRPKPHTIWEKKPMCRLRQKGHLLKERAILTGCF